MSGVVNNMLFSAHKIDCLQSNLLLVVVADLSSCFSFETGSDNSIFSVSVQGWQWFWIDEA